MTILEWMKVSTRYNFEDTTYEKIGIDREISVANDAMTLTVENKELLTADIIFTAVILSPSSTASMSVSHNNFQKTIGSESDTYRAQKIAYMKAIYKKYGDSRYDLLNDVVQPIRFIKITDEI